ncbi:MAG: hypothetical protein RR472_05845 [Anaerovoracaceae bacterium]
MNLLALYLGITLIGYLVGSKLRKKEMKITWAGKIQSIAVVILVLLMGSRLGANDAVVKGLSSIGITAFVLTLFAFVGSVGAVMLARKLLGINKKGVRSND